MMNPLQPDLSEQATVILQGRMGSTRLPGKVLLPLVGKPVMQHVYERIGRCRKVDRIIVATSRERRDDPIAELFDSLGVTVFRGSESDPLDRLYQAARAFDVKHVVRIMADCPLVDPRLVDDVIAAYFASGYDFCQLGGEFPVGLDTTVYAIAALEKSWRAARLPSEREHPFLYIINHPEQFNIGEHAAILGHAHLRWTMDHPVDYQFMQTVYAALYRPDSPFTSRNVLTLMATRPALSNINAGIARDQGIQRAIAQDNEYRQGDDDVF
ncbi:MAG: glycosyltransferase family protein [Desulfatitalea sp.]|nr:glycosyltransferase family protein [Desulfatitalea sp.]